MKTCKRDDDRISQGLGRRLNYDVILQDDNQRSQDRRRAKEAVREVKKRFLAWLAGDVQTIRNPATFMFLPLFCPYCGSQFHGSPVHTHHAFGYDGDNRRRVLFMCRACHDSIHVLERRMFKLGYPILSGFRQFIQNTVGATAYNGVCKIAVTEKEKKHDDK